ncbi:2,3,4,5-tetrahydropyridine-2,6-dicarboxylate N-acetyltransferase [compost metagenome]
MIRYEIILWFSKILAAIPGNVGCKVRNALLPYRAGQNVKIWDNVQIDSPSKLEIGENVSINRFCILHAGGGIKIGSNTLIGPRVTIYSQNHNYTKKETPIRKQGYTLEKVIIGEDVWIASNATILPGVVIGDGCVVGAGSVVTKSLPPFSIAAGVPAKILGTRE